MGDPVSARNRLYRSDNLPVLRGLDSDSVDLVYLDPPFNTRKPQKKESASYRDTWRWTDVDEYSLLEFAAHHPGAARYIEALPHMGFHIGMQAYAAFMAPRLLQLHRVLKPTGSLFLHCDWHASMVLRHLLDTIFGEKQFRNEIIWHYYNKYSAGKRLFARNFDSILFYAKPKATFNPLREQREEPVRQLMRENVGGVLKNKRDENGQLMYRTATDKKVDAVWKIPCLQPASHEYVRYPTQKPLQLMQRIVKAGSNPGDVVLDPFCGCVTMPIAAGLMERRWIGIDDWEDVEKMLLRRMDQKLGFLGDYQYINIVDGDPMPMRTDVERYIKSNTAHKKRLLLACNGECVCGKTNDLEIDRIIPGDDSGPNKGYFWGNVQLLCPRCNRIKGDRPMKYLLERLEQTEYSLPST